ncbi:hypothetical protein CAPTEDRAFT_161660 [Capitella teleta]|uniref:Probable proline--tRNA ligase, mitochondrial n=1 Tax=Capitella teleta TaxID=283909 RepID=N1PBE0_CAPTE|nr:hypothetical protein CAPTEDRAFT_161660 [Capitella teleta]|eukprot:ELU18889.1 hypothetical protein CAPTEDRAFT_161660 [Capitella teleta]
MFPVLNQNLDFDLSKITNSDLHCKSSEMMQQLTLIMRESSGTFSLLPDITRALEKLHRLIDREMQSIGAQKITMPCLASRSLWDTTGTCRWDDMGAELLSLTDRQGKELCIAPTHEETVTSLVASLSPVKKSSLPIKLYQIGRKFRDEMRPKHGLLRCREFEMKDLYTFDQDLGNAVETYEEVCEAYVRLFQRLNLPQIKVEASTGVMGGSKSHEFHLAAEAGEDILYHCSDCGHSFNKEAIDEGSKICQLSDCKSNFTKIAGIEVAHAFLLGTKYSSILNAKYQQLNSTKPLFMGCFGIGVTRLLAAAIEVLSTKQQIRWPALLAPYQVCIIPQKKGYRSADTDAIADDLHSRLAALPNKGREIVLDDRTQFSIGKRLNGAKTAGIPHVVIVGKPALEESPKFEYVDVYNETTKHLTAEEVINRLSLLEVIPV